MLRKTTLLTTVFLLVMCLTALNDMDFYPPSLKKELQQSDSATTSLQELKLSETAASQLPMGKFYGISGTASTQFVYIGRVNACRAGGCDDPTIEASEFESEYFDYFILYDSAYTVQEVKVYNYQASHGQEITSKNWLKQFKNYKASQKLTAGKNIDGISGATISVDVLLYDIEQKTNLLSQEAPK